MSETENGSNHTRYLLVEDDDDHAALVERNLRRGRVGNVVDRVSNGVDALAYLRRQGSFVDRPRPDIVILDLKLPKLDGHEVLDTIKKDATLSSIPVIVLSTSDAEEDRVKSYQLHANSYLVKPLDFEQFRQLIYDLSYYWGACNRP